MSSPGRRIARTARISEGFAVIRRSSLKRLSWGARSASASALC